TPLSADGYSIFRNPDLSRHASWAPRPYDRWRLHHLLRDFPVVDDTFDVEQGIRTALRKAYVITAEVYSDLPDREQQYFRPAVVNDALCNGKLARDQYIFYPYGECTIDSEMQLLRAVPTYYENRLSKHH